MPNKHPLFANLERNAAHYVDLAANALHEKGGRERALATDCYDASLFLRMLYAEYVRLATMAYAPTPEPPEEVHRLRQ